MNLPKMFRSFTYAARGFKKLLKSENNFQFHFLAAILVITLSFVCQLERFEWLLVCVSIAAVFTAEAFNTAIEKLCDLVSMERKREIEDIKDIAAAGVLLTAFGAFIVAVFIFGIRVFDLLNLVQ